MAGASGKSRIHRSLQKSQGIELSIFTGTGTILMLHRVNKDSEESFCPNRNLAVTPDFLDRFILSARERGYSFVSLDDLAEKITRKHAGKVFAITLDDGYADNYSQAYPIFRRHQVPFTIYITTSFPDGEAILWWYAIEEYLRNRHKMRLADGTTKACADPAEKNHCFAWLRQKIMDLPAEKFKHSIKSLIPDLEFDFQTFCRKEALTWAQIREMSKDNLACIGAHTINHYRLSKMSESSLLAEIEGSRERLEKKTGKKVQHFCYPFGGRGEADAREIELVAKLGFSTGTTTRWGNIFPRHRSSLTALPRVPLTNDFTWSAFQKQSLKRFLKGRYVTL